MMMQDAKRDFLQIAQDANADYMIVDAIDVARLFIAYHKICPKDGTPYLDGKCRKCGTPASEPIELTLRVHEELRYNVLSHDDISHRRAKRYTGKILTDPHYSKAALREVIKKATWELYQSRFHRSEQLESHFGEKDADCVFLFVYLDAREMQSTNWVCRTCWIRPDLPEDAKPMRLGGNDWIGDIEIDWNTHYPYMRDFLFQNPGKKEDWVRKVEKLLPKVEAMVQEARRLLEEYEEGKLGEQELQTTLGKLEPKSMNLRQEAENDTIPPFECEECNSVFQAMMLSFYNIFIPFASRGKATWDWNQKLSGMQMYLEMYEEDQDSFRHEWRKIGRR